MNILQKTFLASFFFFLFLIGVLMYLPKVEADTEEILAPCSNEMIVKSFMTSIENNQAIFSPKPLKDEKKKKIEKDLDLYITSATNLFTDKKTSLKNYHDLQSSLFKEVILQSLQEINDDNLKMNWIISKVGVHPIVSLYEARFTSLGKKDQFKIAQHIPSFIVGLEATLNYAILSCNYSSSSEDIIKQNKGLFGSFQQEKMDVIEVAETLLDAKRIIDYSLQAYDSLVIAYPQHQAYEKLIKELKVLKEQFKVFEEINSSCVYPNHFNAVCLK
jgi:hypothetical protein